MRDIMKQTYLLAFSALFLFWSCEDNNNVVGGLTENQRPEVQESMLRLSRGGSTMPGGHQLTEELSNPGSSITPPCHGTEEVLRVPTGIAEATVAGAFTRPSGPYNIRSNEERRQLVAQIIAAGPDRLGTTMMNIGGRTYEVMNDNVTLPDGTYVPLTFPESQQIASAWGYTIPSGDQLRSIAAHAAQNGNQYRAITRTPNDDTATQLASTNAMMNDERMRERANTGRTELIDGHFKWYTSDGRIYGFARGDGTFYQNSPSGAHVRDPGYYDYSHGLRLIRPVQ